jgi:hypothetical protein
MLAMTTTSYTGRLLSRSNRTLFLINIGLLVVLALFGLVKQRELRDAFTGPFTADPQLLLATTDPGKLDHIFVTVTGARAELTGLQLTEGNDQSVTARYVALDLGGRPLLVQVPVGKIDSAVPAPTQFTGYLTGLPDELRPYIADANSSVNQTGFGQPLPYLLVANPSEFRNTPFFLLACSLLIAAIAAWNLLRGLLRVIDPARHPFLRSLRPYGAPREVASWIDADVASGEVQNFGKAALVTRNWLLKPTTFAASAVPLAELVWIHQKVTQRRGSKTYALQAWSRQDTLLEIPGKEVEVARLLDVLTSRLPWVFAGYNEEFARNWQTNRPAILEALAARQAQAGQTNTPVRSGPA